MKNCKYCTDPFTGRGKYCGDICRKKGYAERRYEYRRRRYARDPEFRAKHISRVAEWKARNKDLAQKYSNISQKRRYRLDPKFREKRKAQSRARNARLRAELKASTENRAH